MIGREQSNWDIKMARALRNENSFVLFALQRQQPIDEVVNCGYGGMAATCK